MKKSEYSVCSTALVVSDDSWHINRLPFVNTIDIIFNGQAYELNMLLCASVFILNKNGKIVLTIRY